MVPAGPGSPVSLGRRPDPSRLRTLQGIGGTDDMGREPLRDVVGGAYHSCLRLRAARKWL